MNNLDLGYGGGAGGGVGNINSFNHMPTYYEGDSKGNAALNRSNVVQIGGFGIIGEKKNFDGGPRGKINKPTDKTPLKNRDRLVSEKTN